MKVEKIEEDRINRISYDIDFNIPEQCPLQCGLILSNQELVNHILNLDPEKNIVQLLDDKKYCNKQLLKCKVCDQLINLDELRTHICFKDKLIESLFDQNISKNEEISLI